MIDFLFGWIFKTPMEDTIIDCVVCGIEYLLILFIIWCVGEFVYRLELKYNKKY